MLPCYPPTFGDFVKCMKNTIKKAGKITHGRSSSCWPTQHTGELPNSDRIIGARTL